MSEQRAQKGMKARVLVEGKFKGQIVEILEYRARERRAKSTYRLATTWDGIPYPAWFSLDEIEIIRE